MGWRDREKLSPKMLSSLKRRETYLSACLHARVKWGTIVPHLHFVYFFNKKTYKINVGNSKKFLTVACC